jgi:DNA helicase IV
VNDEDKEILVLNWQSPAARPYYQATVADPGGVLGKRTYDAPHNRIRDWQDISFALVAEQLESLADEEFIRRDDAVLSSLDRTRDNEMRDIVSTIQASQDGVVRSPVDQLLIVQGGPGTGKTAVALHRVSWILFNHREILLVMCWSWGPTRRSVGTSARCCPTLATMTLCTVI